MSGRNTSRYKKIPLAAVIPASLIMLLYGVFFLNTIIRMNLVRLELIAGAAGVIAAAFALWLTKRLPKWGANIVIGLMVFYVASFAVFACAVMSYGISSRSSASIPDGDGSDVIVVTLGCRTYETPGKMLLKRLDSAYEVMEALPLSAGIVCGGQGDNEPRSEASAMAEYLARKGIAPERIFLEDKSSNTEQNIINMRSIIDSEPSLIGRRMVVVTSDFHLLRARHLLKAAGFEDGEFIMRAGLPSDPITTTSNLVREYLSWCKVIILDIFR